MIDDTREYLLNQRSGLSFQIERAKRHLAGLEADEVKIINGKASLPTADIQIVTADLVDHLNSEIEVLGLAIDLIDHELEFPDGDDPYEPFTVAQTSYTRLKRRGAHERVHNGDRGGRPKRMR